MQKPETWQHHVQLAKEHLALGQGEIYLSGHPEPPLESFPWEFVTTVEAGSGFRHNVPTGIWVTATHPSGLRFRWSIDWEPPDKNGTAKLYFDARKVRRVGELLPNKKTRDQMERVFAVILAKLDERLTEAENWTNGLRRDIAAIRDALGV